MTQEQIQQVVNALEYIASNIEDNSVASLKGDGTGWTIADSLEPIFAISESLESIAKTLKNIEAKMK
jgi:methyl-accepting chemotaxis protein